MKQHLIGGILILLLVTSFNFAHSEIQEYELSDAFPFDRVGEELEYSLKWGFFKVGYGYLRVFPVIDKNGEECYHVQLSVKTNSFADSIYKIRSKFNSYISTSELRPAWYRINQHEGKTHRDATVRFFWDELMSTYQRDGEDPKDPVEIEPVTWDPLSVVYAFRKTLDSAMQTTTTLPTTDGKKFLMIDVDFRKKETITTQMGTYDTIKIQPNTKELKGVFKKSKKSKITMWYTNDENRYPLIIKSKVIVGSFVAELKKVRKIEFE